MAATMEGVGVNGTFGLRWHTEGKDWRGFGWNWYGWYPATAGSDISGYKNLIFWVREQCTNEKTMESLKDITVGLTASTKGEGENTETVKLGDYIESLADQKWHEVVIPLSDMIKGKGAKFDVKTCWELRVGA